MNMMMMMMMIKEIVLPVGHLPELQEDARLEKKNIKFCDTKQSDLSLRPCAPFHYCDWAASFTRETRCALSIPQHD